MIDHEINILINPLPDASINPERLHKAVVAALTIEGLQEPCELGVVVVDGDTIVKLNKEYLGREGTTDVIAFYMSENIDDKETFISPPDGLRHLGEVFISYPTAVEQAGEYGHSVDKELDLLVIHGVLHLLGYCDQSPEEKELIRTRERLAMQELGYE